MASRSNSTNTQRSELKSYFMRYARERIIDLNDSSESFDNVSSDEDIESRQNDDHRVRDASPAAKKNQRMSTLMNTMDSR